MSLSVVCQSEALTRHYILELEQGAVYSKQNYSIKPVWPTLPDNPSAITYNKDHAELTLPTDDKRQRSGIYELKTAIVGSISWQWLYATGIVVAYEMILTTKDAPASSWLPVEVVFAVASLLKIYWNPNSSLSNPIQQQEATSLPIQGDHPFATVTMMHGSDDNPAQYPLSESSCQKVPETTIHSSGSFKSLVYSDSGDSNGDPEQHSHTLGLNCFVHPCHGVCRFRASIAVSTQQSCLRSANEHCLSCIYHFDPQIASYFMSGAPICTTDSNGLLNHDVQMPGNVSVNADDRVIIDGLLSLGGHSLPENGITCTLAHSTRPMGISFLGCLPSGGDTHWQQTPSDYKKKYDTEQRVCVLPVIGEDGQLRPCGKVYKNARSLSDHRIKFHSGQRTCDTPVIGENGQQQPCGITCKNAKVLSYHKNRYHSGPKTCD
ncbi:MULTISPECIES: hypothetical protein, partial [unclassified Endozoicomonas]